MIYPSGFENKIGFHFIKQNLKKYCLCSLGEEEVEKIHFSTDFQFISNECGMTAEMASILLLNKNFPNSNYYNLIPEIKRLKTPGTFSEPEILLELAASFDTICNCIEFFKDKNAFDYPLLHSLISEIELPSYISNEIWKIIDEKGVIKDIASDNLSIIRNKLKSFIGKAERKLMQILTQAKKDGFVSDDSEPTLRNGRIVIPVPVTYKRQVKGFIHDESASGQTVFIEPSEVFEINNEIRDLENDERKEIIKILLLFADLIRPDLDIIEDAYLLLGEIDFIRAKAIFANSINAVLPKIQDKTVIKWVMAKHPLLIITNQELKKEVVPADIALDETNRILVISGPNAGGKSVCLKTVCLNQYMLQCGMLIPVHGDSVAGVFNNIFLNIGDDQSLENDLSTYSSHLLNISFFLNNSDNKTLFLIDEFGAGTEPSLGGAIAEAALLELNNKKAFGIVTTHYANIKLLADNNAGIINASMLFDIKHLKPLYILKTGNPGSSFAFEIAAKTGFPEEVLKIAAQKTLNSHLDFEKQLNDIDAKNNILEKKQKELDVADSFLKEIIDKYTLLKDQLENNKDLILNKAKKEALQILDNANSIIENTIREIKESEADALKIKILRKNIETLKQEMTIDEKNVFSEENKASNKANPKKNTNSKLFKQPLIKTLNKKPEAGEMVKLTGQSWMGELVEIKGNMGVVASGVIKMKVPLENIKTVDILNSEIPKTANTQKYNFSDNINEKAAMFKHQLDLRGIRKQEALELLNKYIDDAILLHIDEVYILHGKGNGVLRQAVREYLSNITEVKKMRDQQIELGGSGITIVNFK